MKKIVALVLACLTAIVVAFIPSVYFMKSRYAVIELNRDIEMKFLTASENGKPVYADNNGKKYILAGANYDRLLSLLTSTKKPVASVNDIENKEYITLSFTDKTKISVINYEQTESGDIAYLVCESNGKKEYYSVTNLNLYNWIDEVVDDDGFLSANKSLPD